MHLSHLFEDLASWYGQSYGTLADRAQAVFRAGLPAAEDTVTVNPPAELDEADVVQDVQQYHLYGHSGSMQPIVRQPTSTTTNYGKTYPADIAVSARGDFDTLDNPFYYTSDPVGDHFSKQRAAGLHFIIFQPTIGNFNNSVLYTTHRQNYLVPPRSHRSFPLAEFLT